MHSSRALRTYTRGYMAARSIPKRFDKVRLPENRLLHVPGCQGTVQPACENHGCCSVMLGFVDSWVRFHYLYRCAGSDRDLHHSWTRMMLIKSWPVCKLRCICRICLRGSIDIIRIVPGGSLGAVERETRKRHRCPAIRTHDITS